MPHWNQPPPDDGPPLGVCKGRGFAPAGRGRGIAKWSTLGKLENSHILTYL